LTDDLLEYRIEFWIIEDAVRVDINKNQRSSLLFSLISFKMVLVIVDETAEDLTKIIWFFERSYKG